MGISWDPPGLSKAKADTLYAATEYITGMSRSGARRLDMSWVTSWLSTFQAGQTWTGYGGGSHASHIFNDSSDGYLGPQCSSITTLGTGGSGAFIEKGGLALDLTGRQFVIPIKVSDWTKTGTIVVYASSDASGFANAYQWSVVQSGVAGKIGLYDSNQWMPLTLSFSDAIVIGAPTRNSIKQLRLTVNDVNTGPITAYWGGVGHAPEPQAAWPNGVISLTFDDSGNKQWTVAAPKLSQHGYRGTLYPILSSTGLTQTQIRILHDRMGWEVGAHATTTAAHTLGLPGISLAEVDLELRALRQYLLDNGYEADTFAYPLGSTNAAVQEVVHKYFLAARGTYGNSMETWPPSNLMNLRSYNVGAYSAAQLNALVDKVKANKAWGVFMIHDIPNVKAGSNDIARADFESWVDYMAAQGIPVMPLREVVRSFPSSI